MAAFMRLDSLKGEHLSYKQKMVVQFDLGAPPGKVLRPHSPLGTAKFQFDSGCPDHFDASGISVDGSITGFQPVGVGSYPTSRSRLSRPTGRVAPLKTGNGAGSNPASATSSLIIADG